MVMLFALRAALRLLKKGYAPTVVECEGERITKINVPTLREVLADGHAFRTTGCEDCNRPYYNEKPRDVLYNYHRPLKAEELELAFTESGVAGC